jgi:predicted nucleotidyltransferase
MFESMRQILERDARVAYALVFGSVARGAARPESDLDVAVGLVPGARPELRELADLTSRLESATGRSVDLALVEEAPPALAYRVFRDGRTIFVRDRRSFVTAKARAILEYLDFKPIEDICVRGVLRAATRGR